MADERANIHHDWAGSESLYRRAIELDPDSAPGHQWYAGLLMTLGRFDKAKEEAAIALSLEPLSIAINLSYGRTYYYAREYDRAIRIYQSAIEMDPSVAISYYWLGLAYLNKC